MERRPFSRAIAAASLGLALTAGCAEGPQSQSLVVPRSVCHFDSQGNPEPKRTIVDGMTIGDIPYSSMQNLLGYNGVQAQQQEWNDIVLDTDYFTKQFPNYQFAVGASVALSQNMSQADTAREARQLTLLFSKASGYPPDTDNAEPETYNGLQTGSDALTFYIHVYNRNGATKPDPACLM